MRQVRAIITAIALLSYNCSTSQTIEVDKKDEFTGDHIRQTSWETLVSNMDMSMYSSIMEINGTQYIQLKIMIGGKVFSIEQDQEFMLKLKSGEIVKVKSQEFVVTCSGCGAKGFAGSTGQGIKSTYLLTKENAETLMSSPVQSIRLYTSDGFYDEPVKEKNSGSLQSTIKLLI